MDDQKINALIDAVGVDAIIQHQKVQKALEPMLVRCAVIALEKAEKIPQNGEFSNLENWKKKAFVLENAEISEPTLNRLVESGSIRVNTTAKSAHKRYFMPDVIRYFTAAE